MSDFDLKSDMDVSMPEFTYDRAGVALRAMALASGPPDEQALAWVWRTFVYKFNTLKRDGVEGGSLETMRKFEYAMLSMLAEAWHMDAAEFDTRCCAASIKKGAAHVY